MVATPPAGSLHSEWPGVRCGTKYSVMKARSLDEPAVICRGILRRGTPGAHLSVRRPAGERVLRHTPPEIVIPTIYWDMTPLRTHSCVLSQQKEKEAYSFHYLVFVNWSFKCVLHLVGLAYIWQIHK